MTVQNTGSAALRRVARATSTMGILGGTLGVTALLLFAFASAEEVLEDDQIVASFERALNHEPTPASVVTRSAIEGDMLYETINTIHWSTFEAQVDSMVADEPADVDDMSQDSDVELPTASSASSGS